MVDTCSICLTTIEKDNHIKLPICGHIFDIKCISSWLLFNTSCPLCRENIYHDVTHKKQVIYTTFIIETDESNQLFKEDTFDYINDLIISEKRGIQPLLSWGVNGYGNLYSILNKRNFIVTISCTIFDYEDTHYKIYTNIYVIDKLAEKWYIQNLQRIIKKHIYSCYKYSSINNSSQIVR